MGFIVIIVVVVVMVVAVCIANRKKKVNNDINHCSLNPSCNTAHTTTTNQHNIVYDEEHTTPSCTDNPAYGTQ